MNWKDGKLWRQAAVNTLWCLLGCSIGDMGVIAGFQFGAPEVAASRPMLVMALAMVAGIGTSVLLETILLFRQLGLSKALRTALGMGADRAVHVNDPAAENSDSLGLAKIKYSQSTNFEFN